ELRPRDPVAALRRARPRPARDGRRVRAHALGGVAPRLGAAPALGGLRGDRARARRARCRGLLLVARLHGHRRRPHRRRQLPLGGGHGLPARRPRHPRALGRLQRPRAHRRRRVARARGVRDRGDDGARGRARPHRGVPRHRADVGVHVRARRDQPPLGPVGGERAQVLPPRRLLHRLPALRHGAHLRRDREHQPRRHRRAGGGAGGAREPAPRGGRRAAARRVLLQGRRRAVPHVGARRVRRRP
ncbi:MAG: NADH-ubiquinone oxidoreductase chain N, partial [uncultured Gemmatimonadaceae bacterium]